MIDDDARVQPGPDEGGGDSPRSRLGRILKEHPEARPGLSKAVGSLLGVVVATLALVGILAIWHLHRRAQLIRQRLGPPKDVTLLDLEDDLDSRPGFSRAKPLTRPGDDAT